MKIVSLTIFGVTTIAEATSGVHTRWDTPSASPASAKMSNLERARWRNGWMALRSNGGWPDVGMTKKCDFKALKSCALSGRWSTEIISWIPIGWKEDEPSIYNSLWYTYVCQGQWDNMSACFTIISLQNLFWCRVWIIFGYNISLSNIILYVLDQKVEKWGHQGSKSVKK